MGDRRGTGQLDLLQTALIYAVLAAAWILFSDALVVALWTDSADLALANTLKGWLFVAATACLFYLYMRRRTGATSAAPPPAQAGLLAWPRAAMYALAVVASIATLLLRMGIADAFGDRPLFVMMMFPVILAAILGGMGPGLVATAVVAVGIALLALPSVGIVAIAASRDLFQWSFLVIDGCLVSVLAELPRRSWQRAAAALAERSEALNLLQAIADGSADAIFAKDREGRYLLVNRAATRFTGKSRQEVVGNDDRDIFPPDQAATLMAIDRGIIAGGEALSSEVLLTTGQGQRLFLSTKGPLRDADGRVIGVFGIARDITEQRHSEQALRRQAEELRSRNEELERFNRATVDRELDIIELKKQINALSQELGRPAPYPLAFLQPPQEAGQ